MIGKLADSTFRLPRRATPSRSQPAARRKRAPADVIAPLDLVSVAGASIAVPDPAQLVHLQFRRFAGCPVCNLHLRSIARRITEITDAGIREVVVFHSRADVLRPHVADWPFDVIADPDKRLYIAFGVEASFRALLDSRAWLPIARGIARSAWEVFKRGRPAPSLTPDGGRLGLPADFLIAPDGGVVACKYGSHAYDQWSVDELLDVARSASRR